MTNNLAEQFDSLLREWASQKGTYAQCTAIGEFILDNQARVRDMLYLAQALEARKITVESLNPQQAVLE